jgi:TPR repeat protein
MKQEFLGSDYSSYMMTPAEIDKLRIGHGVPVLSKRRNSSISSPVFQNKNSTTMSAISENHPRDLDYDDFNPLKTSSSSISVASSVLGKTTGASSISEALLLIMFPNLKKPSEQEFKDRFVDLFCAGKIIDFDAIFSILMPKYSSNDVCRIGVLEIVDTGRDSWKESILTVINTLIQDFTVKNSMDFERVGLMYLKGTRILKRDYDKAFEYLLKASKTTTSGKTFLYLGQCYRKGFGTPRNDALAFQNFEMGHKMGSSKSSYYLSKCYLHGFGVEKSQEKALSLLEYSASGDCSEAMYELGEANFTGKNGKNVNLDEAFRYFKMAADLGHVIAQYDLACCYLHGKGTEVSLSEAIYWHREAAEHEHIPSQIYLGHLLEHGPGMGSNAHLIEAFEWYLKAAEKQDKVAQNLVGLCFRHGHGVEADDEQSFRYFKMSANQGHAVAQNHLGQCYQFGTGTVEDSQEAVYWYKLASDQGLASARNNLALCYEDGIGLERNTAEAINLYTLAAEQGDVAAQFNLADWYDRREGNNMKLAKVWYGKAMAQGDVDAAARLKELE